MPHLAVLVMVSARQPMTITVEGLLKVVIHRNSNTTHHRAKATLLRALRKFRITLPRATINNSLMAKAPLHPLALLRLMARLPPCLPVGLSNGTRIANGGSISSRPRGARSGTLPRICLQARTPRLRQALLTKRPAATMSVAFLGTLKDTKAMITHPLVTLPMRMRRRKTRVTQLRCLLLQV